MAFLLDLVIAQHPTPQLPVIPGQEVCDKNVNSLVKFRDPEYGTL